jgi:hypothetical protein
MANSKKFVVKNGLHSQNIDFVSPDETSTITVSMLDSDTLSVSGNSGQLFSITDSLTGTIFAVNDISGVPSIEVDDTGTIRFAETFGNVLVGTATDNVTDKLQINGSITSTVLKSSIATGTSPLTVASTTLVTNLNADLLDGIHASGFVTTPIIVPITAASYTATATSGTTIVLCNTTSNSITVNLPTAAGNTAIYEIKKTAAANSMILDPASTETIDGNATITVVVENESLTLVSDNTNWKVI